MHCRNHLMLLAVCFTLLLNRISFIETEDAATAPRPVQTTESPISEAPSVVVSSVEASLWDGVAFVPPLGIISPYELAEFCLAEVQEEKGEEKGIEAASNESPSTDDCQSDCVPSDDSWMSSYGNAMNLAERRNAMLFIYFCNPGEDEACNRFKAETLADERVRAKLRDYVCVQIPVDATITVEGERVKVLDHPSFREMLGRPGIAIVDYRSPDPELRGAVVSTFPITDRLQYTPEQMAVILDLPPGTLTQRTLIYAVRIHPEKPASTNGQLSSYLLQEAENHAQYQADLRLQGHHQWGTRFQRIVSRLPGGGSAREVCAESWPGENLVEAAIECVRSWRSSSGHWSAVRSNNRFFGYDMKRGSNGVWYATGIFGGP